MALFTKLRKNYLAAKLFASFFSDSYYQKRRKIIDEVLERYQSVIAANGLEKNKLIQDMAFCHCYYSINPQEYLRYQFYDISEEEKSTYVGDMEASALFKSFEGKGMHRLFRDKYALYCRLKKYYQRGLMLLNKDTNYEDYLEFCNKYSKLILKPIDSYGGEGIQLIDNTDKQAIEACYAKSKKRSFVIEEIIEQVEGIGKFHPASINTIRAVTVKTEKGFYFAAAVIRMGTNNSIVDNGTAGAISAEIDVDSGLILTPAKPINGPELYSVHPSTGTMILGAVIPGWDKLKAFLGELVEEIPEQKLIGWDLALTAKGWVIVEGNTVPGVQILQMHKHGKRRMIEKIKCLDSK